MNNIEKLKQELQMCCSTCADKQKMLSLLADIELEIKQKDKEISDYGWEKYPDRMGG